MSVNLYANDILNALEMSAGGDRERTRLKEEIYEWLSENNCRELENLLEEASEYRETIEHLERRVAALEDENGKLLKDIETLSADGT